ncbi:hypothetical protein OIU83_23190 [Flavobacterium sp. LS1R49]|uniref:Uncharacterized protein n=1 Tax=Flavobacterium shii TaxID=2987687 RepID=A0A9X2ZJJ4_9FLAO|nr:hypothetical protein [Flavobacterium shii]MCV9930585.1 hypothetical protein [Flavobacterium shii]
MMGITKKAKNITITVDKDYMLITGGKLEKIATTINIEATKENLVLNCNKKIVVHGNKE